MLLYVDDLGQIKDVGSTKDESLTEVWVNEEGNPFEGWSVARICCYKVTVEDGNVTMMTPYVDTRLIDKIEWLYERMELS